MRTLRFFCSLCAALFALSLAAAAEAPQADRLELKSVADAPDPTSPAQAGSTITGSFEVRPTGANVDNKRNELLRLLRMTVVVRNSAGVEVRTLMAEKSVVRPALAPAGQPIPVSLAVVWDGKDSAGASPLP